jgi:hypothetical protein
VVLESVPVVVELPVSVDLIVLAESIPIEALLMAEPAVDVEDGFVETFVV